MLGKLEQLVVGSQNVVARLRVNRVRGWSLCTKSVGFLCPHLWIVRLWHMLSIEIGAAQAVKHRSIPEVQGVWSALGRFMSKQVGGCIDSSICASRSPLLFVSILTLPFECLKVY